MLEQLLLNIRQELYQVVKNLGYVDGTVIKAHGSSNAEAFSNAIALCYKAVKGDVVNKMKNFIEEHPFEEIQNGQE